MRTRTPLTVAQAAEVATNAGLRCSARTWHRWLRSPDMVAITHSTPGGRKFWYQDEVEAFVRSRCFTPTARAILVARAAQLNGAAKAARAADRQGVIG